MTEKLAELRERLEAVGAPRVMIDLTRNMEAVETRLEFEDYSDGSGRGPARRSKDDPRSPNGDDYNALWGVVVAVLEMYAEARLNRSLKMVAAIAAQARRLGRKF